MWNPIVNSVFWTTQQFLSTPNVRVSSDFVDTLANIASNASQVMLIDEENISNGGSVENFHHNGEAVLQPWTDDLPSAGIPNKPGELLPENETRKEMNYETNEKELMDYCYQYR